MYFEFTEEKLCFQERLAHWCDKQGLSYVTKDNCIWYKQGNIIQALVPFYRSVTISEEEARGLMEQLQGGVVRWACSKKRGKKQNNEWFLINRNWHLNLEELPEKTISAIHSGSNYCEVSLIEPDVAAREGYLIQSKAYKERQDFSSFYWDQNFDQFTAMISRDEGYDDFVRYLGVFFENRLVGMARVCLYENTEAQITHLILDPDYTKFKTREALIWHLIQYYFEDVGAKCLIAGTRPMDPLSEELNYFTSMFQFDKTPMSIHVVFRNDIDYRVSLMRPFRNLVSRVSPDMQAWLEIDQQRR